MPNPPIVVGVDGSAEVIEVVRWAMNAGRSHAAEVLIAHARDRADAAIATSVGLSVDQVAHVMVSLQAAMARQIEPGTAVRTAVLDGEAPSALIQVSRGARLVVLGSRGRAGFAESALGSVAHRVAVHAECPVVIVPSTPTRQRSGTIVVGVADQPGARAALAFAAQTARRQGSSLVLVRAASRDGQDEPVATTYLADQLRALAAEQTGLDVQAVVTRADAVTALTRAAAAADLLVIGCHHSADRFSSRLGTVPAAVLSQLTCPVALVGRVHDQHAASDVS